MIDRDIASLRSDADSPQPYPIADDAWSPEAIAACLPPSAGAARRRDAAEEEDGRC